MAPCLRLFPLVRLWSVSDGSSSLRCVCRNCRRAAVGRRLRVADRRGVFQPQAYSDANDWFGLALIGDLEAVLAAFLVVFGLAAGLSDGRRTFGFMVAGIAASFVLVAALVFSWRPAPRLLRADDQLYLVGGWALLALGLAAVGRALARRRG